MLGKNVVAISLFFNSTFRKDVNILFSSRSVQSVFSKSLPSLLFMVEMHTNHIYMFLLHEGAYRPLSRRLDRCDRVIHNESGDPNGGNMCSFSGATCTSRVRHNADYVPYAKIHFDL